MLSRPNEILDDLRGFLAWKKWQERGWLKRKWDAILGRKPPPAPPLAPGKLRIGDDWRSLVKLATIDTSDKGLR